MYQPRDSFLSPPEDATLWRYMSFTKFVSLLAKRSLFFTRADKLGDPFEGSLSIVTIQRRPVVHQNIPEEYRTLLANHIKDLRRHVLVSCWHENEQESDAMWKLYAGYGEGIAIKTDFRSLKHSLTGTEAVHIGRVNYVDYETTYIRENEPLAALMHKRKRFAHENEVRAVIYKPYVSGGHIIVGGPTLHETGTYHQVDVPTLIREVIVPPYVEDWFVALVQTTAETFGLKAPVVRSSLATLPVWL